MAAKSGGFKLFRKDGEFSKTAFILIVTWVMVWIRFLFADFTIFGHTLTNPEAGLTIGILTAASALYFGNHNITKFKTPLTPSATSAPAAEEEKP